MEMRDLLAQYGYDGENTPIVMGSGLAALEGRNPEIGETKVEALMAACDEWLDAPIRDLDKPFLLPVEGESRFPASSAVEEEGRRMEAKTKRVVSSAPLIRSRSRRSLASIILFETETDPPSPFHLFPSDVFSIPGRGTVVTGRVERGTIVKGAELEILGQGTRTKTVLTGIEMFHKELERVRPFSHSSLHPPLLRISKRLASSRSFPFRVSLTSYSFPRSCFRVCVR